MEPMRCAASSIPVNIQSRPSSVFDDKTLDVVSFGNLLTLQKSVGISRKAPT
jgi:hypothetical protein